MKFHNYTEYSNEQLIINLLIMIHDHEIKIKTFESPLRLNICDFYPSTMIFFYSNRSMQTLIPIRIFQFLWQNVFLRIAHSRCYL